MTGDAVSRLTPLPTAGWGEAERALLRGHLSQADRYLTGEPDAPPIPPILGLLARNPRLGGAWLAFSGTLIDGSSLPARDRELLILRVGHRTRSRYLCAQHLSMGAQAGLDPHQCQALLGEADAYPWCERDRHLVRAADEMVDEQMMSDATWAGLRTSFDEGQLLEVLFVVGSYACLAMVLNSVGLEPAREE